MQLQILLNSKFYFVQWLPKKKFQPNINYYSLLNWRKLFLFCPKRSIVYDDLAEQEIIPCSSSPSVHPSGPAQMTVLTSSIAECQCCHKLRFLKPLFNNILKFKTKSIWWMNNLSCKRIPKHKIGLWLTTLSVAHAQSHYHGSWERERARERERSFCEPSGWGIIAWLSLGKTYHFSWGKRVVVVMVVKGGWADLINPWFLSSPQREREREREDDAHLL